MMKFLLQIIHMVKSILKLLEKKNVFLNKLTNFDLRPKKFPKFTMAQTIISRIDCYIYNLDEKFIVTCNKSYENYFKERFIDLAKFALNISR